MARGAGRVHSHTAIYTDERTVRARLRSAAGDDQRRSNGVGKVRGPSAGAAEFQAKKLLQGRLVHVGETFNRFADFGL